MSEQSNDIRVQLATMFTEHNYNKRYKRLSVVYYMIDGKIEFYQAIRDVPRFTPITDTLYWIPTKYIARSQEGGISPDDPGSVTPGEDPVEDEDVGSPLCITAVYDNSVVSVVHLHSDKGEDFDIQISLDDCNTWRQLEIDDNATLFDVLSQQGNFGNNGPYVWYELINLDAGESVYFKGTKSDYYRSGALIFLGSGLFDVSGRLNSISDNNKTIELEDTGDAGKYRSVFGSKLIFDSWTNHTYSQTYSDNFYIRSAENLILTRPTSNGDYYGLFCGQAYMTSLPKLYDGYSVYGEELYQSFGSPEAAEQLEAMGVTPPTDYDDFCNNTIYTMLDLMVFQGADYSEVMQGSQGEAIAAEFGLSYVPDTIEEFAEAILNNKMPLDNVYKDIYKLRYYGDTTNTYRAYCFANRNDHVIQVSDDGNTFNFDNNFEFPMQSYSTPFEFARNRLRNTNGFEKSSFIIYFELDNGTTSEHPDINQTVAIDSSVHYDELCILDKDDSILCGYVIYDNTPAPVTLTGLNYTINRNYLFKKWQKYINGEWVDYSTEQEISVIINEKNVKYKLCYAEGLTVSASVSPTAYGTAIIKDSNNNVISSGNWVEKGTTVTIECIPVTNYGVTSYRINDDGNTLDNSTSHAFTNVQNDINITFYVTKLIEVRLSVNSSSYGSAIIDSPYYDTTNNIIKLQEGGSITVVATPANGYRVISYRLNGVDNLSNSNTFTFNNIQNSSNSAYFTLCVIFEPIMQVYSNSVTDYDGNTYDAVRFGNKVWLANNFKCTHDANGNNLSIAPSHVSNDVNNDADYGLLYEYTSILNGDTPNPQTGFVQGIAPNGWHIPTEGELEELNLFYLSEGINNHAKDFASKNNWTSYSGVNTPGYDITNNNYTGFNIEPAGFKIGVTSSIQKDNRGFIISSYNWEEVKENTTYFYIKLIRICYNISAIQFATSGDYTKTTKLWFPVRCVYNGTADEFIASLNL